MVYGRLCRYAGENGDAHPSIDAIAREVGIGETQARQHLRESERSCFIGSETRADDKGGQTSNQYFFLWHEAFEGAASARNPGRDGEALAGRSDGHGGHVSGYSLEENGEWKQRRANYRIPSDISSQRP